MTNENIFTDIYMKEPNENNQNIFQNITIKENELIQMNQERYKTKLSLRKKKLTEKISQKRHLDYFNNLTNNNIILGDGTKKINFEKIIMLNDSFPDLISKLSLESKDENKIKQLLVKVIQIIEQRCKNIDTKLIGNIYDFTVDDLFKNNFIQNLYELILIYLKDSEIMELITHLLYLSTIFIKNFSNNNDNELFDNNESLNNCGYFISADKYIDIYNKIFDIYLKEKNRNIIYFMVIFIANIVENEPDNQSNLCISGTLDYILNSIDFQNDNLNEMDMKIWCLSKFELEEKFNIDLELSLKIQKVYIELFLNQSKFNLFDNINENFDENNLFYNFLKVIENLSFCTQVGYVELLYKSNILEFLMDNVNTENTIMITMILGIFCNLTNADTVLLKRLIDIGGLKFLTNTLLDKTINNKTRANALPPINNLLSDPQLWNKVLFGNDLLKIFCVLLKDKNLDENIFSEICYGLFNVMPFCDMNNLKIIIDDYYIIQLICAAMKNILEKYKSIYPRNCLIFINLILYFLSKENDDLREDIIFKFGSINGIEIIDQIINKYNEIDINNLEDDDKGDIESILKIGYAIKDGLKEL